MKIYTYTETCVQKGQVCDGSCLERYIRPCTCNHDEGDQVVPDPNCPICEGTGDVVDTDDLICWEGTPDEIEAQAREQLKRAPQAGAGRDIYLLTEARAILEALGVEE